MQVPPGPQGRRGAVTEADPVEAVAHVGLDRALFDAESTRYLFVGQPLTQQVEDVTFAWRQLGRLHGDPLLIVRGFLQAGLDGSATARRGTHCADDLRGVALLRHVSRGSCIE